MLQHITYYYVFMHVVARDHSEVTVYYLMTASVYKHGRTLLRRMATGPEKKPWFLHGLDSPDFTQLEEKDGYVVRKYASSKWVGITFTERSWRDATSAGFRYLFRYISGTNQSSQKVPMTSPVLTRIERAQNPKGGSNHTVLFAVPREFVENTPPPSEPGVKVVEIPEMTAYVVEFGGFPSDRSYAKHVGRLADLLFRDKKTYVEEYYYAAAYDSPFRLFNRHNEVWFVST